MAAEQAKKAPVVSKDKSVNKNKRRGVVKKTGLKDADLLKMKKDMEKKKAQAKEASSKQAPQPLVKEEEKKEEEEDVVKKVDEEKPVAGEFDKVLDVTPAEEKDIKQKIYMKVYENFL